MKIISVHKDSCDFKSLNAGDVFVLQDTNDICLKTDSIESHSNSGKITYPFHISFASIKTINAVILSSGKLLAIPDDAKVTLIKNTTLCVIYD